MKFIEKATKNENGIVYVHCVHGQSRSCAVCVAFLIHKCYQTQCIDFLLDDDVAKAKNDDNGALVTQKMTHLKRDWKDNVKLLHLCYDKILKARPQMAINPGFVSQLEIFRQMKSSLMTKIGQGVHHSERETATTNEIHKLSFMESNAHAYFRSCRSKSEFQYNGCVSPNNFYPLFTIENQHPHPRIYECRYCRQSLFTDMNIIFDLSEDSISQLPISDYWKDSKGGIEYYTSKSTSPSNDNHNNMFNVAFSQLDNIIKVEPMRWMAKYICDTSKYRGILQCPGCDNSLGYWDWMNHLDLPTVVILIKDKVHKK